MLEFLGMSNFSAPDYGNGGIVQEPIAQAPNETGVMDWLARAGQFFGDLARTRAEVDIARAKADIERTKVEAERSREAGALDLQKLRTQGELARAQSEIKRMNAMDAMFMSQLGGGEGGQRALPPIVVIAGIALLAFLVWHGA